MKPEEKLDMLCEKILSVLADYIRENMPEQGRCKPYRFQFNNVMPDWCVGQCSLTVVDWHEGINQSCIQIGATFPGEDRQMSNFWFHGTKQELLDFLTQSGRKEEMKEIFQHFSEQIRLHD